MSRALRLTVVMTHPVQYYAPWFRYVARERDELELRVLYASEPSPEQQGVGFDRAFVWDVSLREGYPNEVVRPAEPAADFGSHRFLGLDVPEIGARIVASRPDAVLLGGWHSITLARALFACRRAGIPVLYRGDSHLAGRENGLRNAPWRLRTRWLLSRFDRYLSVGRKSREYLLRFGVAQHVLFPSPHAVDNDYFASRARAFQTPIARARERRELDLAPEELVVLFAGKLEPKKRLADLVEAIRCMTRPASLLVAGTGPLSSELEALAGRLGVRARWAGFVNQSELPRLYAISDCLVLPSDGRETWGLVVNEAMATGLPCVVSDEVGCAPDLVEAGRTGETFPLGDVHALAAALDGIGAERARGASRAGACLRKMESYSFAAATEGLLSACRSLREERRS